MTLSPRERAALDALALQIHEGRIAWLADATDDDGDYPHPRKGATYTWDVHRDAQGRQWTRHERELSDAEIAYVRGVMSELSAAVGL
jgi:hypothetical protein